MTNDSNLVTVLERIDEKLERLLYILSGEAKLDSEKKAAKAVEPAVLKVLGIRATTTPQPPETPEDAGQQ